jgi:hypothetical protein
MKHGVLQASILGSLLLLTYEFISDLHPTVSLLSKPISFADGTSIMFHPRIPVVASFKTTLMILFCQFEKMV